MTHEVTIVSAKRNGNLDSGDHNHAAWRNVNSYIHILPCPHTISSK